MEFMLVSSLQKVFNDQRPQPWADSHMSVLNNQRGAFQLAFYSAKPSCFTLSLKGLDTFSVYRVEDVPSSYPCHKEVDEKYLRTGPGLYPDLLKPADPSLPFSASGSQWQALWISFENLKPGLHTVSLCLTWEEQKEDLSLTVFVSDLQLPPQRLYHTEWFHGDCLADYYHVPVFSEEHWQAVDGFLSAAHRCGVNMILTPVFTPPLDTMQGGERTTVQLVDVFKENSSYSFDFRKLRRWIDLCRKNRIDELEISHLFTQWGAVAAPKVLVYENGHPIKKFGWHTPAVGGEYTSFLRSFLTELKKELTRQGMWEHTWFHISDEPSEEQRSDYEAARNSIRDLLPDGRIIDALSSFRFYSSGCVEKPVVCEDHIEPFREAGVPELWTYYCTAQGLQVPNRFFSMPSGRNRILGTLLYIYDLQGFLHWGFNFYNTQFSLQSIDPFTVTDAGGKFPSGDPFLVYPAPDRTAWPSIRSEVLYDGLQDLRLLHLAEEKLGRSAVLDLIEKTAGYRMSFTNYPIDETFFQALQKNILEHLT